LEWFGDRGNSYSFETYEYSWPKETKTIIDPCLFMKKQYKFLMVSLQKTDKIAKRSLKCTIQMVLVFKMFKSWKVEWSFSCLLIEIIRNPCYPSESYPFTQFEIFVRSSSIMYK